MCQHDTIQVMSSSPDWEKLFNKHSICPTCGKDITFDECDCYDPDYDVLEDTEEEPEYE